jgi:hypothetical protein
MKTYRFAETENRGEPLPIALPENPPIGEWFGMEGSEDGFQVRMTPIAPGLAEFSLASAPSVTWWKGLGVFDLIQGADRASVETQDSNHGPWQSSYQLPAGHPPQDFRLNISKAKEFGFHRVMYYVTHDQMFGWKLDFQWTRDNPL